MDGIHGVPVIDEHHTNESMGFRGQMYGGSEPYMTWDERHGHVHHDEPYMTWDPSHKHHEHSHDGHHDLAHHELEKGGQQKGGQ